MQVPYIKLSYAETSEHRRYSYITGKIREMNVQGKRRKIRDRYSYLKAIIMDDIPDPDE